MPPRRNRKTAVKADPAPEIEEQVSEPEVPAKKQKTSAGKKSPAKKESEPVAEIASSEPVSEPVTAEAEAEGDVGTDSPKKEGKVQVLSSWNRLINLLGRKEARDFFWHVHQTPPDEASKKVSITVAISCYVWSQTIKPEDHKKAKAALADAVLDHFGIENLEESTAFDFNCGPGACGLLEKYFNHRNDESYSFTVEETTSAKGGNSTYNVELRVNDVVVSSLSSPDRAGTHRAMAEMSLKYLKDNVDNYVKCLTEAQNRAAMSQMGVVFDHQGQAMMQVPAGVQNGQVQNGQVQNGWENLACDEATSGPPEESYAGPNITDGCEYHHKQLRTLFKDYKFNNPVSLLTNHCAKNKITFDVNIEKPGEEDPQGTPYKTTVTVDGCNIVGVGPGKLAKEMACVVGLCYLKQTNKFDETDHAVSQLIEKVKLGYKQEDTNPMQVVQDMRCILGDEPVFETGDGIELEVEGHKKTEWTTSLTLGKVKGSGKSVNSKKEAKKAAVLDWTIKYERAKKCSIDDIVKKYRDGLNEVKQEKQKVWLAQIKEKRERKREEDKAKDGEEVMAE